jgi:hypothetical protein
MAPTTLDFSIFRLVRIAILMLPLGGGLMLVGWMPEDAKLAESAGLFGLFGIGAVRILLIAVGLLLVATALASLRRAFAGRPAAAIHPDGIELRGIWGARRIGWQALDRLYLNAVRVKRRTTYDIVAVTRRPPGRSRLRHFLTGRRESLPVDFLVGGQEEAERWIAAALMAQMMAQANAPVRPGPAPLPASPWRPGEVGFARRRG